MNAVIAVSGLLTDTRLTSEQREYVETIKSSSEALLSTVNDILDFARIESRKMILEHIPFHLEEVCHCTRS